MRNGTELLGAYVEIYRFETILNVEINGINYAQWELAGSPVEHNVSMAGYKKNTKHDPRIFYTYVHIFVE